MKINGILIHEKDVQPEILNYEASKWKEGTFEQFKLELRPFLSFKRQEGVFWAFRPEDEVKYLNDPQESP